MNQIANVLEAQADFINDNVNNEIFQGTLEDRMLTLNVP